jgi:hypothetical protein
LLVSVLLADPIMCPGIRAQAPYVAASLDEKYYARILAAEEGRAEYVYFV